jgi:aspartyl-tRNA(Asn)/glutamyl-tRNA(Gln) amidotransferase subunit B
VANWVMGEFQRHLNVKGIEIEQSKITPEQLAELLRLIDDGTVSGNMAKTVFSEMFETGKAPSAIVREKGMIQITDEEELVAIVEKVIADNPGPVADFIAGNERAFGFLMGQAMKASKGKANPKVLNKLLHEHLKSLKKG